MALIVCKECQKNYSDKAAACPHCGCPTEFNNHQETTIPEVVDQVTEESPSERADLETPIISVAAPNNASSLTSKNKIKLFSILLCALIVLVTAGAFIYSTVNYNAGQAAMENADYEAAIENFGHSFYNGSKENIRLAEKLIISNKEYALGNEIWDAINLNVDIINDNAKMAEALQHFKKVISEDENYKNAQKAIEGLNTFIELNNNTNKAILLAKKSHALSDYETTESIINSWIKDSQQIYTVYGWNATYAYDRKAVFSSTGAINKFEPDESLYFVSYEFDTDADIDNGCRLYGFEVNIETGTVIKIIGNRTLEKKYRDWGYIE